MAFYLISYYGYFLRIVSCMILLYDSQGMREVTEQALLFYFFTFYFRFSTCFTWIHMLLIED